MYRADRADYDPDKSSGTDIDITPLPSDEINFPPGILNDNLIVGMSKPVYTNTMANQLGEIF